MQLYRTFVRIELVFGDFYTFLSVIRKNGLLNNLEPFNKNFNYNGEVIQSEILNMMLQNDKDYAYPMIANNCCDDVIDFKGVINADGTLSVHWESAFGEIMDVVYTKQ